MLNKKAILVVLIIILLIIVISNFVNKDLNGIYIAVIGDSIMKGYGNEDKGVDYYLSKKLYKSKYNNYAQNSATLSDNNGTNYSVIRDEINNIKGYPQIILLDGGANDIMGYNIGRYPYSNQKEIGKVNIQTNEVTAGNTVISNFEETIKTLKEKYPRSKICYLQMFLIDDETINHITINETIKPELKQRRDDLWKEIKIACEKWQIGYIDVSSKFHNTGLKYRQEDWIHINDAGYKYITPYIIEELDKLY